MASASVPPGFYDAGSIGYKLTIFTGFFIPLQIATVGLRLYVRRYLSKATYGWDDYISICALACQMVAAGLALGSAQQGGVGIHQGWLEQNSPVTLLAWGKYLEAIATWYFFTVNIPKLAILALYHRLFPTRNVRIVIWIVVVILCSTSIATTIASLAACKPFEANFNPTLPGAQCIDKEALYIWSSLPNIVTDLVMLVLPIPIVLRLHLNTQLKAGLVATFIIGSLGLVTSVLRFQTFFTTNSFTDGTYAAVELIIWTQTEPGIYLISACLPTYKVLVDRWNKRHQIGTSSHMSKSGPGTHRASHIPKQISPSEDSDSQTELRPVSNGVDTEVKAPANRIQVSTSISSEWSRKSATQNNQAIF